MLKSDFFHSVTASTVLISGCTNVYNNYANFGGFASINNDQVAVTILDSTILSHVARIRGGLMNIMNAASLTIGDTTFTDFYSPDSMGIYCSA